MKRTLATAVARILTTHAVTPVTRDVGDIIPGEFTWDFERWTDEIRAEIEKSFEASLLDSWPAIDAVMAREMAAEYARVRAGELVTGITETSRQRLGQLVAGALERGDSVRALARELRSDFAFGAERAKLIAVTETATALGQGRKASAIGQGQNQKRWYTSGQIKVCALCLENASAGWLAIDEPFPRGNDTIPGHPGCECDVGHRTSEAGEESRSAVVDLIREARCPTCAKLCAKDVPSRSRLYCRRCKAEFLTGPE